MNTTIAICSAGRPSTLDKTIARLSSQTTLPFEVLVGVYNHADVAEETRALPFVRVLNSPIKGTSAQRNICIDNTETAYILFLDDDVELEYNYIQCMEQLFAEQNETALASAVIVADGAQTDVGYTHEEGRVLLNHHTLIDRTESLGEAIGCNFFVRTQFAKDVRFDEGLPLYGWLEDMDFSTRLRSFGSLKFTHRTSLVHLGVPSGRTSGVRLGYSQIANPLYLWRKSGEPTFWKMIFNFWLRLTLSNLLHSMIKKTNARMDRPGRLIGNIKAFWDLLRARISPNNILHIEK